MNRKLNRRDFISITSAAGAGLVLGFSASVHGTAASPNPALLGGAKAHAGGFPRGSVFDQSAEKALLETLHTGQWYRGSGNAVAKFEDEYEKLTGAKHCIATSCGTFQRYHLFGNPWGCYKSLWAWAVRPETNLGEEPLAASAFDRLGKWLGS